MPAKAAIWSVVNPAMAEVAMAWTSPDVENVCRASVVNFPICAEESFCI